MASLGIFLAFSALFVLFELNLKTNEPKWRQRMSERRIERGQLNQTQSDSSGFELRIGIFIIK
jgi:hypothetical protein